ncbi:hypothetical protein [Ensifer adhaerens]|uniref:hypothetical protein n=1 Tax=Ensifer adhaerens TaxID=106592 RepID=UPI001178BDD9|nr:hypothetical protein [Ensifer adhaerens]
MAKALGAPDRFLTEYAETVPTYWCYGKLEIEFDEDAPHPMNWFQIEFAGELRGDFEILTDSLVLSLEGLNGRTKPSACIEAGRWDPAGTLVNIGANVDDIMINICAGPVQIFFRVDSTFIPDGDAERYIAETALGQIIRDIDGRTEFDSIYSLPTAAIASTRSRHGYKLATDGTTYLAALAYSSREPL